eukprot:TRINITY_DN1157_c0_g2_i3.p1 TRINITY_DN1157_c0_g2~~TRINITY_DN1157_c0_g2_i3.p1  ORF type:complete len:324 (+),score=89.28 TRINITY_DN1157_c0_g2_i3:125-1096(+)
MNSVRFLCQQNSSTFNKRLKWKETNETTITPFHHPIKSNFVLNRNHSKMKLPLKEKERVFLRAKYSPLFSSSSPTSYPPSSSSSSSSPSSLSSIKFKLNEKQMEKRNQLIKRIGSSGNQSKIMKWIEEMQEENLKPDISCFNQYIKLSARDEKNFDSLLNESMKKIDDYQINVDSAFIHQIIQTQYSFSSLSQCIHWATFFRQRNDPLDSSSIHLILSLAINSKDTKTILFWMEDLQQRKWNVSEEMFSRIMLLLLNKDEHEGISLWISRIIEQKIHISDQVYLEVSRYYAIHDMTDEMNKWTRFMASSKIPSNKIMNAVVQV